MRRLRRSRHLHPEIPTVNIVGLHYAPEPSGNAPYTTGLAEYLAGNGFDVNVITGMPHYPQWKKQQDYPDLQADHLRIIRRNHYVPAVPKTVGRMAMEASYAVQTPFTRRSDVLVAVSPALLSAVAVVARGKLTRAPVVLWIQDIYSSGSREAMNAPERVTAMIGALERFVFRNTVAIIVPHEGFARTIADVSGGRHAPIEVVPNWAHFGVESAHDSEVTTRDEFRRLTGAPEGAAVAVHAGNMGAKQGLETVVDAAHIANARDMNIHVVLLGDGNARRDLEERAAGLPNLRFVDPLNRDDLIPFLNAADVLIVNEKPGVREMSIPSKLTTYWSTETPVVACVEDAGLTAREVRRAEGAEVVRAGDATALAEAIARLASDPVRSAELVASGAQHRRRHLGSQPALSAIAAILKRSIHGNGLSVNAPVRGRKV